MEKEQNGTVGATEKNQEPTTNSTATTNTQANETATSNDTTKINPLDKLKEQAKELGLNPDELEIMTKQQMQSYVDSVVTKAIKTREENLKKQQQIEEMKKKGQYEQLLKEERRIALNDLKNSFLQAKGIPTELGALIQIDDLIDASLAEAKNTLNERVENVVNTLNAIIETKVKQRVETMESGTFKQNNSSATMDIPKSLEELRQLPYAEQVKLFQQYPDLYQRLSGG